MMTFFIFISIKNIFFKHPTLDFIKSHTNPGILSELVADTSVSHQWMVYKVRSF